MFYNLDDVNRCAFGRWGEILINVAGLSPTQVQLRKAQPCPLCFGKNRYTYDDKFGMGNYFCRKCSPGNGWTMIQKKLNVGFKEALKLVAEYLNVKPEGENKNVEVEKNQLEPIIPCPETIEYQDGVPLKLWNSTGSQEYPHEYKCLWEWIDVSGIVVGYIGRKSDKTTHQIYWTAKGWTQGSLRSNRPLFGLQTLTDNKDVIVVEGENVWQAIKDVVRQYSVITWVGGANAPHLTDWTPLVGKTIYIVPDNDVAGQKAASKIAEILEGQATIHIINPPDGKKPGWDWANAIEEGWGEAQILEHLDGAKQKASIVTTSADTFVFQAEKLSPFCQKFLNWASNQTFCSDQLLILPYINTAGACLGMSVSVTGPTGELYPNTWSVFLGKSGSGKTTGLKIPLHMLYEIERPYFSKHKEACKQYRQALDEYESTKKKNSKNSKNSDSIASLKMPEYPPAETISLPMITSLERLVEQLSLDQPCGLINSAEEIAPWLTKIKKVDALPELLTSLHGGHVPPNIVSFKNSKEVILPEKALVSLLAPSTPAWFFGRLDMTDYQSGFFQRILIGYNDTTKSPKARPPKVDLEGRRQFKDKLERLYGFGLEMTKEKQCIEFKLSEEAWEFFDKDFFEPLQKRKESIEDDIIISCLDRYWNEYFFKYALILHCLDDDFESRRLISLETCKHASYLIEYFESCLMRAMSELKGKANAKVQDLSQKIVSKLAANGPLLEKDLRDSFRGYSENRANFDGAIQALLNAQRIQMTAFKNGSNNKTSSVIISLLEGGV